MESPAELLRRYGLKAKRSWSQNFLHDPFVVARIVEAAALEPDQTVVELGAGLGVLTEALAVRARRVLAVERDRDLAEVLRRRFAVNPKVEICEANALTFSFASCDGPVAVVGNLPYHISGALLFHLLDERRSICAATLMLQREVAERLAARPGTKAYGAPSVLWQRHAEVSVRFHVGGGAFTPPARVESAVVRLELRPSPLAEAPERLFHRLVDAAFRQRRKTLRRALTALYPLDTVKEVLSRAGIDGMRRGETLEVAELAALARSFESLEIEKETKH